MEQNTIRAENAAVQFAFVEGKVSLMTKDIIYIETNRHNS